MLTHADIAKIVDEVNYFFDGCNPDIALSWCVYKDGYMLHFKSVPVLLVPILDTPEKAVTRVFTALSVLDSWERAQRIDQIHNGSCD